MATYLDDEEVVIVDVFSSSPPKIDLHEVIPNFLFLCNNRTIQSILSNKEHSRHFHFILNCAKEIHKPQLPSHIEYQQLGLTDEKDDVLMEHWPAALVFLDKANRTGGQCIVHCSKGRSRSVTICICYLMVHQGLSLYNSLVHMISKNPSSCPSKWLFAELVLFEKNLFNKNTCTIQQLSDLTKRRKPQKYQIQERNLYQKLCCCCSRFWL